MLKLKLESKQSWSGCLIVTKIIIIGFIAFYLFGNFTPFYDSVDGYTIAGSAIILSKGDFTPTNELIEKTARSEFVLGDWALTQDGKAQFPLGDLGFRGIATFAYIVGGNYGLFYLAPTFAIIFLVLAERFSTKFFGRTVGLLVLLFLATNHLVYRNTIHLQTEGAFMVFFIAGCYYLLSFYQNKRISNALLCSVFFVIATTIRINGIIYFPIEIILLVFFMRYSITTHTKKKIIKIVCITAVPWIAFLIFWFAYHDNFFGDPLTNHRLLGDERWGADSKISSVLTIEQKHLDNVKQYSKYILPYQFPAVYNNSDDKLENVLGKEWLGLFAFISVIIMIFIALYKKDRRLEVLTFGFLIFGTIWFYSSTTTEIRASFGVPARYMMPAFTLYFIILGYYITRIFHMKINPDWKPKIVKILTVTTLIIYFGASFYFVTPTQAILTDNYQIKNPVIYSTGHPPDDEGITKSGIILALNTNRAIEYNMKSFNISIGENNIIPPESIELLKDTIKTYDVFVFKEPSMDKEKIVINNLITNHNFILTDFSSSFYKLVLE